MHPDQKTYSVYLKPAVSYTTPLNNIVSCQLSLRVPTGGFDVGPISNKNGTWSKSVHVMAPDENSGFDYISFSPIVPTADVPFVAGEEVEVFAFENIGVCTGDMEFISNTDDPFLPPNSRNVNVGNQISVAGAGFGVNTYNGPYYIGGYNCMTAVACGITYNGLDFVSPSTCGASDGTMEIFATTDLGLPLQYSIDDGATWQDDPIFTGLNSGDYHVWVRDVASICLEDVGIITLPGPLGPIVLDNSTTQPSCGSSDGSITIDATTDNGSAIEYSIDNGATYQASATFNNLPEGTYYFVLRNTANNCTTQVGPIELIGCAPTLCVIEYEIERLADGRYQISMIPDTTWATPQNITSNLQVTIKAPTGGFVMDDIRSELQSSLFGATGSYTAPTEEPGSDYFTVGLTNPPQSDINYIKGTKIPLFTFANAGTCMGGDLTLMDNGADAFFPPNSQSANVGQQLFTLGYGADVPICLGTASAPCEPTPVQCVSEFILEQTQAGAYQVSMTPDTDQSGNAGRTTELTVTLRVPTGTFQVGNIISPATGVTFTATTVAVAPSESPNFDYVNVTLDNIGTDQFGYAVGQKVTLFTFENTGDCASADIKIMDPATDPFMMPNSASAEVGLFLKIAGMGTDRVNTCLIDNAFPDCPAFSPSKDTVYVTMVTDATYNECLGAAIDLQNGIGNAFVCDNGAFVNASVTNGSECLDLIPQSDFNQQDELCVVYCDASRPMMCDTTIIIICPQVQVRPVTPACAGSDFQFETIGGAGNFDWTPSASGQMPTITLATTTTVSVTADDGLGCRTSADVNVTVFDNPAASFSFTGTCLGEETIFTNTSGSGMTYTWDFGDGSATSSDENPNHQYSTPGDYTVSLSILDGNGCAAQTSQTVSINMGGGGGSYAEATICGGESLQLSGSSVGTGYVWMPSSGLDDPNSPTPTASPLISTTYVVSVMGGGSGCGAVDTFHVEVTQAPVIVDVLSEDLTDCDASDGTIKIIASAGGNPISYSIDCGLTWQSDNDFDNLPKGTYGPMIRDEVTGCTVKWTDVIFSGQLAPTITTVMATPPSACGAADASIAIQTLDTDVEFSIDGGLTWQASPQFDNLTDGSFTVEIRNNDGSCSAPYSGNPVAIMGGAAPAILTPIDEVSACNGATKSVSIEIDAAISNYTITSAGNFSNEAINGQVLTFDVSSNDDNVPYSVLIEAASGCSVTEDFTLVMGVGPVVMAGEIQGTDCGAETGFFLLTAQGDATTYTYDLDLDGTGLQNGVALSSNSTPFADLAAGTYDVTVFDDSQCSSDVQVLIETKPVDFGITANETAPNCDSADGAIELTGAPANASYNWEDAAGNQVSVVANTSSLAAGDYYVTVTDDDNGCAQTLAYTLAAVGAPTVTIDEVLPTFCPGDNNGSVTLTVAGTGNYTVSLVGTTITRSVAGNEQLSITDLEGGQYQLSVLEDGGTCESTLDFTVVENQLQLTPSLTMPTSCSTPDGQICLNLSNGTAPYVIQGDFATLTDVQEGADVCIDNLASKIYTVEIFDANGCKTTEVFEVFSPDQPSIADTDFVLTGLSCPDDSGNGGIASNTANAFNVLDTDYQLIGQTPVANLAAGDYIITYNDNGCNAQRLVSLNAPDAWNVDVASTDETCDGNDGTITLNVTGANGGYSYDWQSGVDFVDGMASNLNSVGTYSVTIQDSEGCQQELTGLSIDYDCVTCDPVFTLEQYQTTVDDIFPTICLPINDSDISNSSFTIDGTTYTGSVSNCAKLIVFYDMMDLNANGTAPFVIDSWTYGTQTLSGVSFTTMEALATQLTSVVPEANFYYDATNELLIGEVADQYGDLAISHSASADIITAMPNSGSVNSSSIELPGSGIYEVVVVNDQGRCPDTLLVDARMSDPNINPSDTMYLTTTMDSTLTGICDISGVRILPTDMVRICRLPQNGSAFVTSIGCLEYTPDAGFLGTDEFCVEVCDQDGNCTQTLVIVDVTPASDELVIYTGFSPNGDNINDYLRIDNIEAYPNNTLRVYNRWGNLVYEKESYSNANPWNGTFNEIFLPDGTYYVMIDLGDGEETIVKYIQIQR